ncbi:MAG: ABC transporter permease [Dorea sp.]|jgi:hypothetical protein|nr:ABC transporter permease [Dorea sp.]MCI9227993.1 ABC transporter permease [Dorea sp.]
MFNLLNMDLYRVKRSRSCYICLGIFLIGMVVMYGLLWLMAVPEGQKISVDIGMLTAVQVDEMSTIMDGTDSLILFRQASLDGGMYNIVLGVWVALFVCSDYQSGFIKNILALHQNRWNYVGSRIMTVGIVNLCCLILNLIFALVMNRVAGDMVPYAGWEDYLFYMSWVWLLTTAFASLMILICVLTRSVAAGSVAAVLLGSGVIVLPVYSILNMFHIGGWLEYSIYLTMTKGPGQYTAAKDLYVYAVGAGFLILYTVLTGIVLEKQDI